MTDSEMYVKFRTEIETMYAPLVLDKCEVYRIQEKGREIGILLLDDGYIMGLYVKPKYRRQGYGRRAIIDYCKHYGFPNDLTILNTNKPALAFWNSIFNLEVVNDNGIDTYYKIKSLKDQNVIRKE